MGFDTDLFDENDLNEELICSICACVLEKPLMSSCDHIFCGTCITKWLRNHDSCPIDRSALRVGMLRKAPRIIINLINKLKLHCPHRATGCKELISVEQYYNHVRDCDFHPNRFITCDKYCLRTLSRKEMQTHDCIKELIHETYEIKQN
ncbi:E3 ubiquitin-protein ligase NRDP1 [Sarcoptes scabiei]|nr:E3 ubiquitin-protein ligase NRDP1 [Sarcoptes scabiei]